jgi:trehalose 6-phosphate synthase
MITGNRLIVVSNRLPITVKLAEGGAQLQPSGGGLVSVLIPVLRESGGCWVGWTGTEYDDSSARLIREKDSTQNCCLEPVFLNAAERDSFYRGFSNEIIWPLFHNLPSRCQFDPSYWKGYCDVNGKFADAIQRVSQKDSLIWVHDYHLMMLARDIRSRRMAQRLAYFHHIPFPAPDIFETLPWRAEILTALTAFDVLGFQTARDRRNFMACLHHLLPNIAERHSSRAVICPVSVDYDGFAAKATEPGVVAVSQMIRKELRTRIILGVDRLDYTKGIPERLTAFQKLLDINAGLRGKVTMLQIVVPSREEIPEYERLRLRIETLISKINGQYSRPGWIPIHYFYRSVSQTELTTFYRAADAALVTSLRDGMNLVAKEFCVSRVDNRGVLILSEFAGAAEELERGALMVNPYDIETVASSIRVALEMSEAEQGMRMQTMRSHIRAHDVFQWFRSFTTNWGTETDLAEYSEIGLRPPILSNF